MDTGKGKFILAPDDKPETKQAIENKYIGHGGWFKVGEIVEINGSTFRIKAVKPTELRLKLLPKQHELTPGN